MDCALLLEKYTKFILKIVTAEVKLRKLNITGVSESKIVILIYVFRFGLLFSIVLCNISY